LVPPVEKARCAKLLQLHHRRCAAAVPIVCRRPASGVASHL